MPRSDPARSSESATRALARSVLRSFAFNNGREPYRRRYGAPSRPWLGKSSPQRQGVKREKQRHAKNGDHRQRQNGHEIRCRSDVNQAKRRRRGQEPYCERHGKVRDPGNVPYDSHRRRRTGATRKQARYENSFQSDEHVTKAGRQCEDRRQPTLCEQQ